MLKKKKNFPERTRYSFGVYTGMVRRYSTLLADREECKQEGGGLRLRRKRRGRPTSWQLFHGTNSLMTLWLPDMYVRVKSLTLPLLSSFCQLPRGRSATRNCYFTSHSCNIFHKSSPRVQRHGTMRSISSGFLKHGMNYYHFTSFLILYFLFFRLHGFFHSYISLTFLLLPFFLQHVLSIHILFNFFLYVILTFYFYFGKFLTV